MGSRAFRSLLRYIWGSLVVIVAIAGLYAVMFGPGLAAFDQVSPNVLFAAGVLAVVGGGSAAGTMRGRGPVILRDHIFLREKERFDFAVIAVLLGLLYFGLAAAFFVSSYGLIILAVATLVPFSIWLADSVRGVIIARSARPPKATG